MPALHVFMDGEGCWPDLLEKVQGGRVLQVPAFVDGTGERCQLSAAVLPGGMQSGKCAVSFRLDFPNGLTVMTETSLALLESLVRAAKARYGG